MAQSAFRNPFTAWTMLLSVRRALPTVSLSMSFEANWPACAARISLDDRSAGSAARRTIVATGEARRRRGSVRTAKISRGDSLLAR